MIETWTRRSLTRRIAVPLLITATALVMTPALLLLSRQSARSHDLLMEYESLQASAAILELFVQRRPIEVESIDPNIIGFGIYSATGELQLRHGTAPSALDGTFVEGYELLREADPPRIRVIRVLGRTMPMGRAPAPSGSELAPMPGPGPRMRGMTAQPVVLVDYNIADHLAEQHFGRLVLGGFALALAGLSLAGIMLHSKLEAFAEQEQRRRKLVELGHASRTLAHEIKNPLGAIRIQTALLRKRLNIDPTDKHRNEISTGIEVLEKETERIVVLVDEMRDFLRSGAGTPQRINLVGFLHETVQQYEDHVQLEIPEQLRDATVQADPTRLRSVFENLLGNAVEASPPEAPVRLSLQQLRRIYRVTVSDSGTGVAARDKERIFDAFYSTKAHGSGVGLAVVRHFVESAGGTVSVGRSREGGAEFAVTLPRVRGTG